MSGKKSPPIFSFLLLFIFYALFPSTGYAGKFLKGRVTKVSDGDTVWVRLENGNRARIRVWGMDTPEKFRSKKLSREAERCAVPMRDVVELGKLATKRARKLLDHRVVLIETHGRGYYGRLLGRLILADGEDFGLEMIRSGYACAYDRSAPGEYLQAEEEAKAERRGLWERNYSLMECLCR